MQLALGELYNLHSHHIFSVLQPQGNTLKLWGTMGSILLMLLFF